MAVDMATLNRWYRAAERALAADLTSDLVKRGNTILVASATTDGKRYHVRLDGNRIGGCDCDAGLNDQPCKHRAAVAIRLWEREHPPLKITAIKPGAALAIERYLRAS